MKKLFAAIGRPALLAGIAMTSWVGSAAAQAVATPANDQCSLAVVSRLATDEQNVCDGKLVREVAERGRAFEQRQLGIASVLAIDPGYTDAEALNWFARAAQKANAPAQVNLAVMYANGWGTPVNYGAALNWLHRAADQGFARAYTNLGIFYLIGQGVRQDYDEAFRWFQKGAEAGDSNAQASLANLYADGHGCTKDLDAALAWFTKAAKAGSPFAQNNLAVMYLRGEGVAQNAVEAFRLFQLAADQGHTGARIMLGSMYAEGIGAKRDPEAAYMWLSAASLAGDQRGDDRLPALAARLTPAQVSEARERAQRLQIGSGRQFTARALVQ